MASTAHGRCMSRELKGKLKGKSQAQRNKAFASASKKCAKSR